MISAAAPHHDCSLSKSTNDSRIVKGAAADMETHSYTVFKLPAFAPNLLLLFRLFRSQVANLVKIVSFPKRWEVTLSKLTRKATYGLLGALMAVGCYTSPGWGQSQGSNPPSTPSAAGQTTTSSNSPAINSPASGSPASNSPGQTDPADTPASGTTKGMPAGYRIGVDDSLYISVWREPDLSTQVMVRPDGVITLPLVNDLKVAGMTTEELKNTLTDRLKAFVNEPQVTVTVRDIRSRKVFLVGQAGHPGSFMMTGNMTVLELLAQAGGVSQFGKSESIYVLRNENGHQVRIPFKYKRVIQGKMQDVLLEPGDMVVVP